MWFDHLNRLVDQRTRVLPAPTGIGPAQCEQEQRVFEKLGIYK